MRPHRRRLATAVMMAMVFSLGSVVLSTSASAAADIDSVVAELRTSNVYIEEDAFAGEQATLDAAVERARGNGIDVHVAVLADDTSGIRALSILEGLNEDVTVLLFSPAVWDFESAEICDPRFDEASANVDTELQTSNADLATAAFIDALIALPAEETCESSSSDGAAARPWWQWLVIALAAMALMWFLWSIFRSVGASRRREREAIEFDDRRRILQEWAGTLRAPITELQVPVAQAKSSSLAGMFNDALKVARESDTELEKATTLPELDRSEIRIARAQMQIRDVRKALDR